MKRKKILLYITLFALILNVFNPLFVFAADRGDIKDPEIGAGDILDAGHAMVTKKVKKTSVPGRYTVTFDVIGKNNSTISKEEARPYIVYVVDRSATMTKTDLDGVHSRIYISRRISESSSSTLERYYTINRVTNVQIAAITFADDIKIERNFRNSALMANTWSGASGLNTLTYLALKEAVTLLNNVTNATSKHIILLSDGLPWNGKYDDSAQTQTILEATNAKESGIEIFSVFIQEKNSPDAEAKELMDNVASLPTNVHSFEASDSNSLSESFTAITKSITQTEVKEPAATKAKLVDEIANDFTYVPGSASSSDISVDGKTVTINVDNVGETKKSYSFDILIDEDASTGWHRTNDSFNLTGEGLKNTVSQDKSSMVYWKQYGYKIEYYYDGKLGETTTGEAKSGEQVCVTSEMIENKRNGYEFIDTNPTSGCIKISKDESKNVIKVNYEQYKKLIIQKKLENIKNNKTKFNIKITLRDKDNTLLSGEYKYNFYDSDNNVSEKILEFVDGKATISLKGNEKAEFVNIQRDSKFDLEELNMNGYKTEVCVNDKCDSNYKYSGTLTKDIDIVFVNIGDYELPETGSSWGLILIITGITFTGGAVIYILKNLLRKNKVC